MSAPSARSSSTKQETRLVKKEVPFSILMRQRAQQQFASMQSGQGPIPTGQLPRRDRGQLIADASSSSQRSASPRMTPTLKSKPSISKLSNDENQKPSPSQPRLIRTRASVSNMKSRVTAEETLVTRSPNIPSSQIPTQTKSDKPVPSAQENATRRQTVAASPVLSALIKSSRTTRRIRGIEHINEEGGPNIISGGGIKVKSAPSPVRSRVQRAPPTPVDSGNKIKLPSTPRTIKNNYASKQGDSVEPHVVRMKDMGLRNDQSGARSMSSVRT